MKNILIILITGVLLLTSCNKDFLNVAPQSQLSSATFWRDENDATKAATGVYASWGASHQFQLYFSDNWSDDAIPTGFWHFFYYYTWGVGNISPQNEDLNTYWGALYSVIRTANVFLTNVDKCQMDETLKNRLKGEVSFIRAYEYALLYYTWGEVPVIDKPLGVNELKIGKGKTGSTAQFILETLDVAIDNLPVKAPQAGRVSKGAALALKARVLLYEGRYDDAAAAAKKIMEQNNYALLRAPAGDGYYQLRNTKQQNNLEEILAWQSDGTNRNNELIGNINFATNYLMSPTKALVDAYDGYDKATDKIVPVDESTTTSRFKNRDPRLDFSIAHTGTVFNGQPLNSETAPLSNHSTGYGVYKFITDEVLANTPKNTTDYILFRYAEVLLTYAEAKIEANKIDQSVLDALNEVRSRAYGTTLNDVSHYPEVTTMDQGLLRKIVRNERRVELAFEGLRWFDLKRWKIAAGTGGTMNGPVLGALLSGGTYKEAGERKLSDPNRDYLRPIPQAQIDLVGKSILIQNEGY
jgi:hypothetical protein